MEFYHIYLIIDLYLYDYWWTSFLLILTFSHFDYRGRPCSRPGIRGNSVHYLGHTHRPDTWRDSLTDRRGRTTPGDNLNKSNILNKWTLDVKSKGYVLMISFKFIRFNFCCLSIKLTVSGICEYVGRVLSYVSNLTSMNNWIRGSTEERNQQKIGVRRILIKPKYIVCLVLFGIIINTSDLKLSI